MTARRTIVVLILAAVALTILGLPLPTDTAPEVRPAMALTVFIIGMWASGSLPEHLTAIAFFLLAMIFSIAPPGVIFSGFQSSAFWLVFGGMILGVAADATGLGRTIAHALSGNLDTTYPKLISGIVLVSVALAFLVPSAIGRMIILTPIILGLADQLDFKTGSSGRTGMVLATTFGSFFVPLTILPANLVNVVLAGAADTLYGVSINYGEYLLMHLPITGLIKGAVIVALICIIFPERMPDRRHTRGESPRLSPEGRRLTVIVGFALIAWITDFVHGVPPGWIALVAAFACLLPGIGVLGTDDMRKSTNLASLLYVAAILGLGAVVASSGTGALIADGLLAVARFDPATPGYNYAAFSAVGIVLCTFATLPGAIVVLAPFADQVAEATGLPLLTVLMILVNGFSTLFLPYQSAPILVGLRLGGATMTQAARITLPLAAITICILLPLNYLWWQWLGYLP